MAKDLLDIYKDLYEVYESFDGLLAEEQLEKIAAVIGDVEDTILTDMEIPQDNTLEMEKKFGDKWPYQEETYCRDVFGSILWEYSQGEFDKKEAIRKIENYKIQTPKQKELSL